MADQAITFQKVPLDPPLYDSSQADSSLIQYVVLLTGLVLLVLQLYLYYNSIRLSQQTIAFQVYSSRPATPVAPDSQRVFVGTEQQFNQQLAGSSPAQKAAYVNYFDDVQGYQTEKVSCPQDLARQVFKQDPQDTLKSKRRRKIQALEVNQSTDDPQNSDQI